MQRGAVFAAGFSSRRLFSKASCFAVEKAAVVLKEGRKFVSYAAKNVQPNLFSISSDKQLFFASKNASIVAIERAFEHIERQRLRGLHVNEYHFRELCAKSAASAPLIERFMNLVACGAIDVQSHPLSPFLWSILKREHGLLPVYRSVISMLHNEHVDWTAHTLPHEFMLHVVRRLCFGKHSVEAYTLLDTLLRFHGSRETPIESLRADSQVCDMWSFVLVSLCATHQTELVRLLWMKAKVFFAGGTPPAKLLTSFLNAFHRVGDAAACHEIFLLCKQSFERCDERLYKELIFAFIGLRELSLAAELLIHSPFASVDAGILRMLLAAMCESHSSGVSQAMSFLGALFDRHAEGCFFVERSFVKLAEFVGRMLDPCLAQEFVTLIAEKGGVELGDEIVTALFRGMKSVRSAVDPVRQKSALNWLRFLCKNKSLKIRIKHAESCSYA